MLPIYGIVLAITSGFLYGIRNILIKKITNKGFTPTEVNMIYNVFGLMVMSVLIFVVQEKVIINIINYPMVIGLGAIIGLIALISGNLQNNIFHSLPYSYATPFYSMMPIIETVFAFIIIGERISAFGFLGIIIISIGAIHLNLSGNKTERISLKQTFPIIINLILFSILSVFQKKEVLLTGSLITIWVMYAFICIWGIRSFPQLVKKKDLLLNNYKPIGTYMICAVLALFTSLSAYQYLPVGVISALRNVTVPVIVLIGSIIFGEGNLKSRLIGSGVIVSGAIVMGFR